jgi:hypothetical protein
MPPLKVNCLALNGNTTTYNFSEYKIASVFAEKYKELCARIEAKVHTEVSLQ